MANAAPQPEPGPEEAPLCFVCLEGSSAGDLLRGCACRGGAGYVHVACLALAAQAKAESNSEESTWHTCPTCKQEWTGALRLALARARWELVTKQHEESVERLDAALNLTHALRSCGQLALPATQKLTRRSLCHRS